MAALHLVALTGHARDWIKARCWRRICNFWAEADAAKRPLSLVSKHEFEALLQRRTEGVG
jgi:chromosomal replication initiator protein